MKQADLSLGKGELQTCLDYSIVDSAGQITADKRPLIDLIYPGSQLEIHRAIAVTYKEATRRRMLQHVRLSAGHRLKQLNRLPGIGAIIQPYRQIDTPQPIAKCPICHPFRNQLRVGDDNIAPLRCAHSAGAGADAADLTHKVACLYGIANVDRTLEEQDQAGDKIVHHALEPETRCQHRTLRPKRLPG